MEYLAVYARILAAVLILGPTFATLGSAQTAPSQRRTITMAAVEPRGGTMVEQEPFPTASLPSGGYVLRPPDATGRWEVSTYRWDPSQVIVNQGDEVTLEIVGINGAAHPTVIEGYNLRFNVKRGEITRVTFRADRAGVFRIDCATHRPSMVGELVVLPRQQ
jgi:plastocyanin